MVTVLEELATDKSMDRIIASVKQIPLSASSTVRRVHVLAEDVQRLVLDEVKEAQHISLAIDESTDNTDISQLSVFVRCFDGKAFKEELLALIALEGNTTADIIFGKLEELFQKHGLSLEKVNLIVTDGAPAMVGKNTGLVSRIKNVAPKTNALHCLIHQSVLCAKLSGDLKEVMDKTMKIINFIRGNSSTQHRLFRKFVLESQATHDDLLLHNHVRWLSKGKALERFIELRDQVVDFLKQNLLSGRLLHFNTLKTVGVSNVTESMKKFITQLRQNFSARFDDFSISRDVIEFVHDPFLISPGREFSANLKKVILLDEAAIQSELVDIQASSEMKAALRGAESLSTFWVACPQDYGTLRTLAMYVLTMFGSTYTCESAFSKMNTIKTHERNRLSNQSLDCLRISLTSVKPDVKKLVSEGKCNFSH
ncbi:SCAN domain-containing protein 3-like [Diretmus argenteus]